MSENLLNHLNRRINGIISKCSIPIMNVKVYILYKKMGEGSYGDQSIYLYFYLIILIEKNRNEVNYIYFINLIKNLNEEQTKIKNGKKKIIVAKIIIDLINNYEQSDEDIDYDDEYFKKFINVIKDYNLK